ncbi:hypothetical protein AJ85_19105 [Alkalihalobacillus alcalophilus ATCC 27647 = CGMCC 1.3604]|uniref:CAAX prenyl protease 2/Lysostaphin resistance protein A-like domain-containing protein n=2 Tax=Alkalihalobacillus alcalophilus TaxID=1445 RepID=A0A4S4JWZ6_ALKAL|nr:hypothetical protein AJ85_19105 [Alkalihalobacillus alcalophilus ATCC 27647 = CGMCC 1.3604]
MIAQWLIVIILYMYWVYTGRSFIDLFSYDSSYISLNLETILGIGVGVGIVLLFFSLMIRYSKAIRTKIAESLADESIQFLLPSTFGERVLFLLVAVTAGVCEEIIFRGVMLYYFSHFPIEVPIIFIGVISSLLFGIVHLYQGLKGVLLTAYLGAVFFFLFVLTGSLWIPILLHILVDAKFVFLPNKKVLKSGKESLIV